MTIETIKTLTSFDRAMRIKELKRVPCGAAGLIYNEDEDLLLLLRTGAHGSGTWGAPGGWVEAGEDPVDTIQRECWEEVGITLGPVVFDGYTFDQHPEGIEGLTLWFRALAWTGIARAVYAEKVAEIRWVKPALPPQPLFPAFSNAIAKGIVPW